ncbi:hypothetical protein B0H15DRAFT_958055 [Mycena belliarum]|uniref:Uncharacterized protein n=1 Tax=Mycena belliarum TaxID=1033014 RepID=A0AAD6TPU3_9AGAR|nr:hypothetical protein B0H15DRAFT_958055 [Mycena belliae]
MSRAQAACKVDAISPLRLACVKILKEAAQTEFRSGADMARCPRAALQVEPRAQTRKKTELALTHARSPPPPRVLLPPCVSQPALTIATTPRWAPVLPLGNHLLRSSISADAKSVALGAARCSDARVDLTRRHRLVRDVDAILGAKLVAARGRARGTGALYGFELPRLHTPAGQSPTAHSSQSRSMGAAARAPRYGLRIVRISGPSREDRWDTHEYRARAILRARLAGLASLTAFVFFPCGAYAPHTESGTSFVCHFLDLYSSALPRSPNFLPHASRRLSWWVAIDTFQHLLASSSGTPITRSSILWLY